MFLFRHCNMSHLHHHKPHQKNLFVSTKFGCEKLIFGALHCLPTQEHTQSLCIGKIESNKVFWTVTNKPTGAQARKRSGLAKWSTTHPIHQLPLGMWNRSRVNLPFTKKPIHNTSSRCCSSSVVIDLFLVCVQTSYLMVIFTAQVKQHQHVKTGCKKDRKRKKRKLYYLCICVNIWDRNYEGVLLWVRAVIVGKMWKKNLARIQP